MPGFFCPSQRSFAGCIFARVDANFPALLSSVSPIFSKIYPATPNNRRVFRLLQQLA